MVASAVYILDVKGKVLINRNYRGDISSSAVDKFIPLVLEAEEEAQNDTKGGAGLSSASGGSASATLGSPVVQGDGLSYVYVKHHNLYILAITRRNSDVAAILVFLHKTRQVFEEYFKDLQEESIRDNFVIIYELLDEMMDFGYPQITESKILQEYITQESHKLEVVKPSMAVTNAVSWRTEGLKYRKNEVFLDVVESVNLLANSSGTVLRSEVIGQIKMRVFLSGMPELKLGLNDKLLFEATGKSTKGKAVEMEDVKFHQCVRLSRFDTDRTISFIPPDGDFELMSYRLNAEVKPLIWVESVVESYGTRIEYIIKSRAQFKRRSVANNVEIHIPVPEDADSPKFKASVGTAKYAPEKNAIVWSIKQFPGGKEFLMRAQFGLPSVRKEDPDKKPPISIKFEIPYFSVSGIQVRYLKIIEKSGYQALPWVRYITQNGDYELRMPDAINAKQKPGALSEF